MTPTLNPNEFENQKSNNEKSEQDYEQNQGPNIFMLLDKLNQN
jgi:hypothetical protein